MTAKVGYADVRSLDGMALRLAPQQVKQLQPVLPDGWRTRPNELLAIRLPEVEGVSIRTGLSASACARSGRVPTISLGVLDRHGRGVYEPPARLFRDAVAALEDSRS